VIDPTVLPDGLVTGGAVIAAVAGGNNNVDVAALTCYLAGVLTSVNAAVNQAATRGTTNGFRITSVTVTSAGAVAMVAGTESTAFTETRGAAGGPPLIPVGSIEIAQVRLTTTAAAPVKSSEIFAVVGTHVERYDSPAWTVDYTNGQVVFDSALATIHTGNVTKAVRATAYTPLYTVLGRAVDWKPADQSVSVSTTDYYGGTATGATTSLNAATFTAYLNDGTTDGIIAQQNRKIWIKFQQDRNKAPYQLTLGYLTLSRTFPKATQVSAACQVVPEFATVNFPA
jgi:hypothetical protein